MADMKHALTQALIEIDAYRMMLDLEPWECRRTFSCAELDDAGKLGLRVQFKDGEMMCWPES